VFDEVFWDAENDMMGLLRSPVADESKQLNYEARRGTWISPEGIPCLLTRSLGRFYLFWNCTEVSGRPMLGKLSQRERAHA